MVDCRLMTYFTGGNLNEPQEKYKESQPNREGGEQWPLHEASLQREMEYSGVLRQVVRASYKGVRRRRQSKSKNYISTQAGR